MVAGDGMTNPCLESFLVLPCGWQSSGVGVVSFQRWTEGHQHALLMLQTQLVCFQSSEETRACSTLHSLIQSWKKQEALFFQQKAVLGVSHSKGEKDPGDTEVDRYHLIPMRCHLLDQ